MVDRAGIGHLRAAAEQMNAHERYLRATPAEMLALGRILDACQVQGNRFSGAVRNANDADAYCDAEMDYGRCLSEHGMSGSSIASLFGVIFGLHGREEEPFLCGES